MTMSSAKDIYDGITFNSPDAFFNKPAPDPWVAFTIGGILSFIGFVWWIKRYQFRVNDLSEEAKNKINMNLKIRMMISAAIDNDRNRFVMVTYSAVSFLFLGGFQMNFEYTLLLMFLFYAFSASLETIRLLLAYHSVSDKNHDDLVISSAVLCTKFKEHSTKELKPGNVYEDLGRNLTIVTMIFITQVVLISFVCVDMLKNNVNSCVDGTKGCPLGGTLGSWLFFTLGIFMALVFQLGPKTNFGESEQNPTYWLRLFLVLKDDKTSISWRNGMKGNLKNGYALSTGDYRVWVRYFMSSLINGVGFHILVHALPLQVASQSSLTGVVFRAIGMMYLVDLDDTPGYTLTIHDADDDVDISDKEEDITEINEAIVKARNVLKTLEDLVEKKQGLTRRKSNYNSKSDGTSGESNYGSISSDLGDDEESSLLSKNMK